jgi:hypothetical protein
MDDIYLDTRDCTPKDEFAKQATHDKSHIFCPFQVLKRRTALKSD